MNKKEKSEKKITLKRNKGYRSGIVNQLKNNALIYKKD